jgi:hypothetical protein
MGMLMRSSMDEPAMERIGLLKRTSNSHPWGFLAAAMAASLLAGCVVVRADSGAWRSHRYGPDFASCAQFLARAHAALAGAADSPAAAHAAHAAALHEYHICLASGGTGP